MFEELEKINTRPKPFEFNTVSDLWTDEYTSKQMLSFHLNEKVDISSRNAAFIERSAEWIASHFNVGAGTKIADFGCGPGLYTTRLAKKQADVIGIDFSKRSIEYAEGISEKKGLSIRYIHQNYLDFEIDDRFHLILMIMCDFSALSRAQRKKMLNKFHTFLEPDGYVFLDVYSLNAFEEREEIARYETNILNGFWSPNKYYGFLNTFKYDMERVVLDKYTLIEADRNRIIYNWLQYFSPEALEKEVMECGLMIEKLYSDVAGSPFDPKNKEFAVVIKKE